VFGYNPSFSKEAALAFAAPEFGVHDWHLVCMLAVSSMKRSGAPSFDVASANTLRALRLRLLWQRTYAEGLRKCFDLPPRAAGDVRYAASFLTQAEYLERCQRMKMVMTPGC